MDRSLFMLLALFLCLTSILSQSWINSEDVSTQDSENGDAASPASQLPRGWLKRNAEELEHDEENVEATHAHSDQAPEGKHHAVTRRDEHIHLLEHELDDLREGRLRQALNNAFSSQQLLKKAESSAGWLASSEEKERIQRLDSEVKRNMMALAQVQAEEKALQKELKPLYGIVSYSFYAEQRNTIKSCVGKVQEIAYNNAWWSGIFNAHRKEGLADVVFSFVIEWLTGYILMYPFAVGYYAFWAAPWSILEYSSGSGSDVFIAILAWAAGVLVMLLPLIALGVAAYFIFVKYGDQIAATMAANMRQREAQRQQQQQYRPRPFAVGGGVYGQQ